MFTRTLGLSCLLGLLLDLGFSQTICPTGKYGVDCELNCNDNCLKNCHKVTGTCEEACVVGRYDSYCDKICNCTFGCDKETGYCPCDLYGCSTCNTGGTGCSSCDVTSYFVPSSNDGSKCCSRGCNTDAVGILDCDTNGVCALDDCIDGYWGDRCTICHELITNCETCESKQNSNDLICQQCLPGYDPSVDQSRCCPPGCDDCNGDICSVCKPGYYIYNEICDTCGDYCQPPGNGSARCNPVTGACFYGCLEGWHGLKCDVKCALPSCETCDFKEADRLLTCKTCVEGWAPNEFTGLCQTCNDNCVNSRCNSSTGYCTEGCMPGWRSDRCDQSCEDADMGNCTICGRDSFTCSECKFDFWGATCENVCSQNCVPLDNGHVCVKDDAACMSGCMPGYWREDCNRECPNCLNDVCQIADGVCQDKACKPGYWGPDCMRPCSANCANNPATGDFECQFETGICTHGCKYNQYGALCDMTCSSHCLDNRTATVNPFDEEPLCSQLDGSCKYGCENNYHKSNCSDTCHSTCVTGQCDRAAGYCLACDEVPKGWLCYDGNCVTGSRGLFCNETCPTNCNNTCHRYNSTCDGCLPGFYDDFCDVTCGNCVENTCNQVTGTCDVGCQDGYHGDLCLDPCNHDGCMSCDRDGGECIVCLPGLYGSNCSESCSSACVASADGNVTCDKDTGACTESFCLPGWYSPNCDMPCPGNCQPSDDGQTFCKFADGFCDDGCLPGWFEPQCDVRCNSNCGNGLCNRTGYCTEGCMEELYGYFCEENCTETCNDNACDREMGNCEECYVTEPTFECRDAACPPGSQGLQCDMPCPSNCFEECHRYNSTCNGCDNGFFGDLCEDQCGNCVGGTCNQTTGYCEDGCLDEWYGLPCEQRCPDDNCQTCNVITGTCRECKPGYFGNNCEKMCSSFCAPGQDNRIRCHRTSGFCNETRCKAGYFLEDCTRSCNDNCGQDFNNDRPCEILTGTCAYDCTSGWYGDTCNRQCSENCVDGLCSRNGFCISGCETGFYGEDCRLTCAQPLTCNDGTCHRYNGNCSACDEPDPTPVCRTADCDKGLWGLFCNNTCPANCQGGVCIRDTGLCQYCNPTWYTPICDQRCLNCKEDICLQSNGHCIRGCKDGFYTDKCDVPCLHNGCQDCTRDKGTCITCKVAKFNSNCSEDCSPQCETTDLGFRTCSKASGYCDAGECIDGYWSETCREECSPFCGTAVCDLVSGRCEPCLVGYFGLTCRSICSPNCKNSNCKGTRDTCVEGCANGFWGTACEKKCNDNCVQNMCDINDGTCLQGCQGDEFYGPTCQEPCNSNCASGQCERDGYCIGLCKNGTYGDMCENACPVNDMCTDMTCDRMAGNCSECDAVVPGPLCPGAVCPSGKRGTDCQLDCTSNTCRDNRCTRDTDVCVGCNVGIQGTYCDKPCGNCKVGTGCDQLSGVCDDGCRDGYHGDKCDQECDPVCESCERDPPAQCVVCRENRWGSECQNTCSANCAKTVIGTLTYTRCEKDSGACSEGACKNNRYWSDDCSIQCPITCLADGGSGYKTCSISDGTCSNGCDTTFYGPQCTGKCSVQCKDQVCENSANNCIRGCADGFYSPPTCSSICSPNCLNPGRCNSVDGTCIGGCKDGYFGERCREACFGKCTDGKCDDQGGCPDCRLSPVGPLCHPQVCPSLKYGPSCESDCPGLYCLDGTCERQSGKCPQGCLSWYHGEYCSERCICHTPGTVSCNQDGVCQCKIGWTSVDCSQTCSDGCRNSECEKNGQCTVGCIPGRYGLTCESSCSGCVNEDCDSTTGECRAGCKHGFYGELCDEKCPENCAACDSSARCTQCSSFLYGLPTCSQSCSDNCKPRSGRTCMESNGACVDGCNTGHWGSKCDQECGFCGGDGECSNVNGICSEGCKVGYYTPKCTTPCSDRCVSVLSNTKPECNDTTGACKYGCKDGYYGNTCEDCSANCQGKKCSSATVCTDGCEASYYSKNTGCNLDCSRCKSGRCNDTGHCISGCESGFYGPQCQRVCSKTCKDETCDQTTGECADCSKTPVGLLCKDDVVVTETEVERLSTAGIIGVSAGCAVAVIIIVILLVVCIFYRRKASDAKHEIHLPSDMIDRLSTHRSHHSTISSQYPVARVVGDDEKDFVLF